MKRTVNLDIGLSPVFSATFLSTQRPMTTGVKTVVPKVGGHAP